ncbi:hypothetical protein EON81_12860 [bacterium]|nr:MAG: hypothetical protein EON81_12860 [bacterium]
MNRSFLKPGLTALGFLAFFGAAREADAQIPQASAYVGAAPGATTDNTAYGSWINRPEVWGIDFMAVDNWSNISGPSWMLQPWGAWTVARPGRRMMISVPMFPEGTANGLQNGANGDYDGYFATLATNLVANNLGNAVVRLGWEFNGSWEPWRADVSPTNFKAYWIRVVNAMRAVAGTERLQFCWCPAAGPQAVAADLCWPGKDYVDYIGMDIYDDGWPYTQNSTPTLTQQQNSWSNKLTMGTGLNWLTTFATQQGRPVCFPEWGLWDNHTRNGGGDDPTFIQNMYDWMRVPANNVAMHSYFDYTPDAATVADHRIWPGAGGTFVTQFPNSKTKFLQLFTGAVNGATLWGSTAVANTASTAPYKLDKLGTSDWSHWGTGSFVHASAGGTQISNVTQIGGTIGTNSLSTRYASWAGGTPTATATNNQSYIFNNAVTGQGWTFTVPASSTPRALTVLWGGAPYAGTNVKLVAHLNDGSAPDFTVTRANTSTVNLYTTTLNYTAASNTTLQVTVTRNDNSPGLSVDLKGAWLTGGGAAAANAHSGTYGAKAIETSTPSYHNLYQIRTCATGSSYVGKVWVKGTGRVQLRVFAGSFGTQLATVTSVSNGSWVQLSTPTFSTGANTQLTYCISDSVGTAGTVYLDDAFLGISGGTNILGNPGFELGNTTWTVEAPYSILLNP